MLVLGVAVVLVGIGAPVAGAQDPSDTQYGNVAAGESAPPRAPSGLAGGAVPGGTLPFSGLNMALAVAAGAAAVGGGFGLRRLGRKQTEQS
jgi:hypothetical protein